MDDLKKHAVCLWCHCQQVAVAVIVQCFMSSLFVIVECINGARSLRLKLAELQNSRRKVADGFDLGTLLHIRGNVATYSGQREIKAFHCGLQTVVELPFS